MKKLTATVIIVILLVTQIFSVTTSASESAKYVGKVNTESTKLNVRSSNSSSSRIIGSLSKDSYVSLVSKSGNWWKVEYKEGKYGYCHADYISKISADTGYVKITSGYLNVRTGQGTTYTIKDKLYNGEKVFIIYDYGTWAKILYDGNKTGYVKKQYISSSSQYIKMNVPYYSQTDSRWSGVYLGSSGKTMGKIGCTTTSLAMTESYRTGTTVYPNTMASRLSYSSSGSLYWPSNYVTTTNVSFSAIKNILNQGKPVILGLRTASYNTHWVVVTGYSNDTYYVNDSGMASRTTLGSVFSKYPYFYKMAYYK